MSASSTTPVRRLSISLLLSFGITVFAMCFVGEKLDAQGQFDCFKGSTDFGESYCGKYVTGSDHPCNLVGDCIAAVNGCNPSGHQGWTRIENPINPWPICDGPYNMGYPAKDCKEQPFACGTTINYDDQNCVFVCSSVFQWGACAADSTSDPCSGG